MSCNIRWPDGLIPKEAYLRNARADRLLGVHKMSDFAPLWVEYDICVALRDAALREDVHFQGYLVSPWSYHVSACFLEFVH
jgi:hypothetical protein